MVLACVCLLLCLLAWHLASGRRRRGFVEIHPRYRSFLRCQGLTGARDFLDLQAVIVGGHPDRNVARVVLGEGPEAMAVFLKREHRVPWLVRLANLLAGFGLVSRSLRETRVLQALQREGIACPEWLAAGEDGRGRAFLLTRALAGAVELRRFLRRQTDPETRLTLAHNLGAALARLHDAGFDHPDLYANHIFVDPQTLGIQLLDWQRSSRRRLPGWRRRGRDLAALNATLSADLAGGRERLVCLRAYLHYPELPGQERSAPGAGAAQRCLLFFIHAATRRLLRHRHIQEKRQPALAVQPQDWVCVEGQALCVTSALDRTWPDRPADWLSFRNQPAAPQALSRRWLPAAGQRRALLVRRRRWNPLAMLWAWLRRRPLVSPEQRQAELLLRLQRHAVPAPSVLAMGQRRLGPWQLESFLLTEPAANALPLETWLLRQGRVRALPPAARSGVLRQAGALLQRMHQAGCYLRRRVSACPLGVQIEPEAAPVLVLERVEDVHTCRRLSPELARRDLQRLERSLVVAGCSTSDWRQFVSGYQTQEPETPAAQAEPAVAPVRAALPAPATSPATAPGLPVPGPGGRPPEERSSFWQRLVRGARRLRQRPDWVEFAGSSWDDHIMEAAVTDRFHAKQGRSVGRWILPAADARGGPQRRLSVYLKRHYELGWWRRLLALVWPGGNWSPAMQEWQHLEWARRQGVPVPEVVAAGEIIGPWGRFQSFLAVEELAGMLPLHEAIPLAASQLEPAVFRCWKRRLVVEMARLTRMLHDRRTFHKDLYLCHFYIARGDCLSPPEAWRGRVFLIDLHRLAHHPWTWRVWQLKDLAQLLYSSEVVGVDTRDRLAFWREYRGPGPAGRSQSWLRRLVVLKWRRYRRHNARHKHLRPGADKPGEAA